MKPRRRNPPGMFPIMTEKMVARIEALTERHKPLLSGNRYVYPCDVITLALKRGLDALEVPAGVDVLVTLTPQLLEQIDDLANAMSTIHERTSRAQAIRVAVARALEGLAPGKGGPL